MPFALCAWVAVGKTQHALNNRKQTAIVDTIPDSHYKLLKRVRDVYSRKVATSDAAAATAAAAAQSRGARYEASPSPAPAAPQASNVSSAYERGVGAPAAVHALAQDPRPPRVSPVRRSAVRQSGSAPQPPPPPPPVDARGPEDRVVPFDVLSQIGAFQHEGLVIEAGRAGLAAAGECCCRILTQDRVLSLFQKAASSVFQDLPFSAVDSVSLLFDSASCQQHVLVRCVGGDTVTFRGRHASEGSVLEGLYRILRVVLFGDLSVPLSFLRRFSMLQFDQLAVVYPGECPTPLECRIRVEQNFLVLTETGVPMVTPAPPHLREVAVKWTRVASVTATASSDLSVTINAVASKKHHRPQPRPLIFANTRVQLEALLTVLSLHTTVEQSALTTAT